jgi:hypothetical protein
LRWQSGSGDTAFARTQFVLNPKSFRPDESSMALRFPPHSMKR